ncbi:PorP/SprF family type IX secretion system membrane protein [Porifericola rhodea]|uniref:PorP/SprF family type IX secretion system membrane protein n=1 Tax=Porifericola rhodea TaxID=930972 RepID=UPI002665C611|nr:PorP/SprF family type IX secretion system membrane protein [Porifericola rhodea]WKN29615.1 PorP/SprF family type IX secretion system membrane protein [Porifericola rhodea]
MKKLYFIFLLTLFFSNLQAQTRKQAAHFSLLKSYYNPALTGFEGSVVKGLYRSQWSSYEGAPSTVYLSAELNMHELKQWQQAEEQQKRIYKTQNAQYARHAFGLSFLKDTFGPYYEHQLHLSYSSNLRITRNLNLRAGAALTYNMEGMDAAQVNLEQSNDPFVMQYMQNTKSGRVDVNLGMMLSSKNFFLGYALQDATKGQASFNRENTAIAYAYKHIIQSAYRTQFSEQFALIVNGIYQYDEERGGVLEGQMKALFYQKFWATAGYRKQLAYTFGFGVQLHKLNIGYAMEVPTGEAQLQAQTNELSLSYRLGQSRHVAGKINMW